MGLLTTGATALTFGSALVWSGLRHFQLRAGPRRHASWTGLVFARRGYNSDKVPVHSEFAAPLFFNNNNDSAASENSNSNSATKNPAQLLSSSQQQQEHLALTSGKQEQEVEQEAEVQQQAKKKKTKKQSKESKKNSKKKSSKLKQQQQQEKEQQREKEKQEQESASSSSSCSSSSSSSSSQVAPRPNTLEALRYAASHHASGVHVDVRLCKSGELVLTNDNSASQVAMHELKFRYPEEVDIFMTAEEAIHFCREHTLKLIMDIKIDSESDENGIGRSRRVDKHRRQQLADAVLHLWSHFPATDRDMHRYLNNETLFMSDDPRLLYKIRDENSKIACGIICRKDLWSSKKNNNKKKKITNNAKEEEEEEEGEQKDEVVPGKTTNNKEQQQQQQQHQQQQQEGMLSKALDFYHYQLNYKLAPWILGASCVSLPRQQFSDQELHQWRSREILIQWRGFKDDPCRYTIEMRDNSEGTCLVADGEFIKFFPS